MKQQERISVLQKAKSTNGLTKVVIESPYGGNEEDIEENLKYLRAAMHDCFSRGEAPFASHGLYTQYGVLNDSIKEEREIGILGGFEWAMEAEKRVIYKDLGITSGMEKGIEEASKYGQKLEFRTLEAWRNA